MKRVKEYLIIAIAGIAIGIGISYINMRVFGYRYDNDNKIYDVDYEYIESDISEEDVYGIFSREYYRYFVTDTQVKKIKRINLEESVPEEYAVTKNDENKILNQIIGIQYDTEIKEDEGFISYKEIKDGVETGAYAAFSYDDNNQLIQLFYRNGKDYDLKESDFISLEKVKDILSGYAIEKYGEGKINLNYDYEIKQFYSPEYGQCYVVTCHGEVGDEKVSVGLILNALTGEIIDELAFV